MKYIFYTALTLSITSSIYFIARCDDKCTELKIQQAEIQMKQTIEQERIRNEYLNSTEYAEQQKHKRQVEIERARNEVTVRRDTEQVVKDRLLEKGTDIGVNIGLNLLGEILR